MVIFRSIRFYDYSIIVLGAHGSNSTLYEISPKQEMYKIELYTKVVIIQTI